MTGKPTVQDGSSTEVETARVLLGTIGDTTWRMFVPSIGFTLFGVWLDSITGMKPWLMLTGVVLGFAMAVILVRRQVDQINRHKEKGYKK